jgi:hypothetical protein
VGKPSDAPRQRNLARGLHEGNRAVCIISTMAIGLQRASPSIGRCFVVDVVVEGMRQGSNSHVLGPKQECFPSSDFTCENINKLPSVLQQNHQRTCFAPPNRLPGELLIYQLKAVSKISGESSMT